jgi:18S rRNA (adenine1779-N6/adenine1780-N6)-dimethyltransferase
MIETNYKTYCAQHDYIIPDEFDVKTLVNQVLVDAGFAESRASKMDVDDFLALLHAFHQANIHFA